MIHQLQSKLKENELRHKYEVDKFKTAMDSKFNTLSRSRENEWEKAWEKREKLIIEMEKKLKEVEAERHTLRETLNIKEFEIEAA